MAEVAVAAYAVGEVIETTAQVGVAAYLISKPTMPLKATFTQIATSSEDKTRLSLCRADHTLSVVGDKAFIFGGETASGKVASNDIHVVNLGSKDKPEPDYSIIPAVPDVGDGKVPVPRKKHAACAFNVCVAVFGGIGEDNSVIDEDSTVWLYNTSKCAWETLKPANTTASAPKARSDASLFNNHNNLVLYGGRDADGTALHDVWCFDYVENTWTQQPDAPVSTPNAAVADGFLHIITGADNMSSDVHSLQLPAKGKDKDLEQHSWQTVPFPTNPLTPGPRPRIGGGLIHVTTGYGRNYLTYLFGARQPSGAEPSSTEKPPTASNEPTYWSDIWTYQIPSSSPEAKVTTSLSDVIKPAKIKDKIRNALGYDSGEHSWCEVDVLPPADLDAVAGKVHPGPRGFFGCDVMEDGRTLVMWGGVNAKGEKEGDGWTIKLE
ncbi:hypothetical protein LTR08_001266 [Meristemomyces frigidus]|nr:hypothetical protein LTR08_001266 [Meristemomyces frigidus]